MRGLEKVLLDEGLKQSDIFYLESLDLDSLQTDKEIDRDFTDYSATESIRTLFNRTSRAQASQEQPQAQEVEDKPIEPQEQAKSSFLIDLDRGIYENRGKIRLFKGKFRDGWKSAAFL